MDAVGGASLYVETLVEPYSLMPLVGVGGFAAEGIRVDVQYDGVTAASIVADGAGHFATQLPREAGVTRLRVVIDGVVAFDQPVESLRGRETPAAKEAGPKSKLLGVAERGIKSVASGEVFSPSRWAGRADRFAEFLLKGKQKVRNKRLTRRHPDRDPHAAYCEATELTPARRAAMAAEVAAFRYRPTFSILVPVYNVPVEWFRVMVESVRAQLYPHWQLCLADDASTDPKLIAEFERLPKDGRIKLIRREKNGHICAATNTAADAATGEFVALLDHDDALAPHALYHYAKLLQSHPDVDLIYSDEDKIDERGRHYDPQFKPEWSPDLLLSYNFVNHFTCIRKTVFEKAGRYREGYEGSQDHDLLLRVTERTDRIHRVPEVLYHWRSHRNSTASAAGVKQYVHTAGRKAVEDALKRRGIPHGLSVPAFALKLDLPVLQFDGPAQVPSVAVIVHGDAALASATIQALNETPYVTPYLVLDSSAESLNRLASARTEDVLVFLEAGVEPMSPDWLPRLIAYLQQPGVGVVGGLIRDETGTVESAGTILNLKDGVGPGNAALGTPKDGISYYFYAEAARTVTAPGRGVLAVQRSTFDRAGGFDSDRFLHTLFDVDFCLRVAGLGLRSVHVGGAEFRKPSPASERSDDPVELLAFRHAHGKRPDPFSNPNFDPRQSFKPLGDSVPSVPAGPRTPINAVIAAHNLNNPEGAPRYLSEIVLGLRTRGAIHPTVWSPVGGAGADVYTKEAIGVTVADQPWGRRFIDGLWTPREYEAAQNHLMAHLRKQAPGVVVANTLLTFPVVEAAARLGIPSVWIIHESYAAEHLDRLFPPYTRNRIRAAFRLAGRVVPASHDTAKLFAHWNVRGNVRVLHNGLDPAPFDNYSRRVSRSDAAAKIGSAPGKTRFVAVGTVCERKGQHTLVEAAAALAKKRSDFEVYLVGVRDAVPYAGYVRHLVQRRGLQNLVKLVAETDDPFAYYRGADAFVCPSHMETFSRAVLEAMAFGLPVLSTACCGVSEQVHWGFNALRFEPSDANQLAERMLTVLDPATRTRMAKQSRAAFDALPTYADMLDSYEAVLRAAVRAVDAPPAAAPLRAAA